PAWRRECDPPRSVEVAPSGDALEERAVQVVLVDDPSAISVDLVAARSLDPVRDEDARSDRLNAERREALREIRIDERSGGVDGVPAAVEHVDLRVGEVRGVEPRTGGAVRDREALELGAVRGWDGHERGRRWAAPRADGPVLRVEDEGRGSERGR